VIRAEGNLTPVSSANDVRIDLILTWNVLNTLKRGRSFPSIASARSLDQH
jgi:hypothetical protein